MPYDLFSPAFKANPFPTFAQMRAQDPIYAQRTPDGRAIWYVTRYEDVTAVLKDDVHFCKDPRHAKPDDEPRHSPLHQLINENMLISIPPDLPLWLHFDLRQLGHWSPTTPLTCTPYSIAAAAQKGYNAATIQWLLETATQTKLPYTRQRELQQWARHRDAYKLRAVHLLTTARPSQMAALLRRKRLRAYVYEHLAPRHATVSPEIQPHLQKWLAAQGYPLDSQHPSCPDRPVANYEEQPAMQWLALRVLIGLHEIIPPSYPSPYNLLAQFDAQLSPAQKTNLEATATNILDGIRDAIRGRDAFFPQPIDAAPGPQHRHIILQAIADETPLDILYQGLTDQQPIPRTIYPLRLEDHGALSYLYAYCENAEAERTFRLDRIHTLAACREKKMGHGFSG